MYKYKLRPVYGGKKLLIDFFYGAESNLFISDLLKTIETLHPVIIKNDDLYRNDEVLINIKSKIGEFSVLKDSWGFAFIMADDNQECLLEINSILEKATNFEKDEVDFEDYK